jgi:hypothetical protein
MLFVIVTSARPCPKLTIQAHGTWSSLTGSYVSRVQLMCDTGYVLIGGNSSTSIDCLANGTWSNSNTTSLTCNGKLIIQSKVIHTILSACIDLEGMIVLLRYDATFHTTFIRTIMVLILLVVPC